MLASALLRCTISSSCICLFLQPFINERNNNTVHTITNSTVGRAISTLRRPLFVLPFRCIDETVKSWVQTHKFKPGHLQYYFSKIHIKELPEMYASCSLEQYVLYEHATQSISRDIFRLITKIRRYFAPRASHSGPAFVTEMTPLKYPLKTKIQYCSNIQRYFHKTPPSLY
jgi:hypothetical protein